MSEPNQTTTPTATTTTNEPNTTDLPSDPRQRLETLIRHYWAVLRQNGESPNQAAANAVVLAKKFLAEEQQQQQLQTTTTANQSQNNSSISITNNNNENKIVEVSDSEMLCVSQNTEAKFTVSDVRDMLSKNDVVSVIGLFQSQDALSQSFSDDSGNINFDAVYECYRVIRTFSQQTRINDFSDANFGRAMCKSLPRPEPIISNLDNSIEWNPAKSHATLASPNHLLILLAFPGIFDPDLFTSLSAAVIFSMTALPEASKKVLVAQMATLSKQHLLHIASVVQNWLTVRLCQGSRTDLMLVAACQAMLLVFEANKSSHVLELSTFYNDALNDDDGPVDLKEHYMRWHKSLVSNVGDAHFSVCRYPCLLDTHSKSRILQFESELEMAVRFRDAMFQTLFVGPLFGSPYFILHIKREHVIRDCIAQLQSIDDIDLKKPLKVAFDGEAGVDEGGVKKEFFQIVIRELFDVDFGMFTLDDETSNFWFNRDSFDNKEFELVGTVLGLAIYNSIILDLHFPDVVYKKLLNRPLVLEDIKSLSPSLYRTLSQIRDYQGDIETDMGLNFEVTYTSFGEPKTLELIPDGSNVPLTNANKDDFLARYMEYILQTSIRAQWESFSRGFRKVCNGHAFRLFEPEELELLVCGSQELDFRELEHSCQYDAGYDPTTPIIRNFWEIVHGLPLDKKKRFLSFCTGSDRAPIKGLGHLPQGFTISRNGPDSDSLPTAHTCFNHLLLPEYSSRDKLQRLLVIAIENAEGFGLR